MTVSGGAGPNNSSETAGAELREDERYEWGVRHSQGTRVETSEAHARDCLEIALQRKRRYDVSAPFLVRRRVSDWAPVEDES